MTKLFCDLCGEPALTSWPSLRVNFPNMTWRGSKGTPGSIGLTDGNWTPHVEARIIFDAHDMPNNTYSHHPDLCRKCVVDLLLKIAETIK